jgi:hypothetical protein
MNHPSGPLSGKRRVAGGRSGLRSAEGCQMASFSRPASTSSAFGRACHGMHPGRSARQAARGPQDAAGMLTRQRSGCACVLLPQIAASSTGRGSCGLGALSTDPRGRVMVWVGAAQQQS